METEIMQTLEQTTNNSWILQYLPYVVTVICALITGFTTNHVTKKQLKEEMKRLEKQYQLDIEKEREKFNMEKERMELEFKHQLELQQKQAENEFGANATNTLLAELLKMPEVRQQLAEGIKKTNKRR